LEYLKGENFLTHPVDGDLAIPFFDLDPDGATA
jgi:hypothetical protein